jgi:hypothetical protein
VVLWDQVRDALSTVWANGRDASEDERTRLISELTAAWQAEQRLTMQVRQIIPAIPYEQFRRHLDLIARTDEQHAAVILERLKTLGGMLEGTHKPFLKVRRIALRADPGTAGSRC